MSKEDMQADMDSLRQINNMMYLRPSQSSLTCKRQVKIQPFQTVSASPGDTIQVIFNSGDEFLYGPTSVIKLQYQIFNGVGGGAARTLLQIFGVNGTILNLFKSIRLTHRSGQELAYIDEVGIYASIKRLYEYNTTAKQQLDALLNYNPNYSIPNGETHTFVSMIPLELLAGLFSSQELMPPQLVAGLRMELQLKPSNQVITEDLVILVPLQIRQSLLMDCVTPYDSVVREIVEQTADSSSSGLQYTYETAFYTSQDSGTNTTFSLDIQNSVSIASRAFFVMQPSTLNDTLDKMAFFPNCQILQWRCGAEYFPNQQIVSVQASGAASSLAINQSEQYKDTVIAFMSYPHQFGSPQILGSSVQLSDYSKVINLAGGNGGSTVYGQTLDRSPAGIAGAYSGLQTNNSRLLNVSGTKIQNAGASPNVIKCWMISTRVANLVSDSCIVDR